MQWLARKNAISMLLAGLAVLPLSGCAGYQIGPRSLYRSDIHTVYVPMFESDSYRKNLGEWLTEAVIKEIEFRSPYKVVHAPDADSVLSGRLTADRKRVVSENIGDQPRDLEVTLLVQVSWIDRRGDLLMQPVAIPLPPVYLTVGRTAEFVPESGQSMTTAQQEAMGRLASEIVQQMEAPW